MRTATIHPLQATILEKLLYSTWMTFTELQWDKSLPTNQLSFHINTLLHEWYIEKNDIIYTLTTKGKEYANAKDSHTEKEHKFQKVWTIIVCSRTGDNHEKEYLFYTRKKHPFYGKQWFPTGKIRRGETPVQTAARELTEESWLSGNAQLISLFHFINKDAENDVIEDKYLFLCSIKEPTGELIQSNEWSFYRVKYPDIEASITNPFETTEDLKRMISLVEWDTSIMHSFEEKIIFPEGF